MDHAAPDAGQCGLAAMLARKLPQDEVFLAMQVQQAMGRRSDVLWLLADKFRLI